MNKTLFYGVALLAVFVFATDACSADAAPFDLVISNGVIVDGTGRPGYRADLAIKDGRIAAIGVIVAQQAQRQIDAEGLVIAPGFIDLHTHAENRILTLPSVDNYIRQGVTTVVGGNCGSSPYPIGEFLAKVRDKGSAPNLILLVGHNTLRRRVMGSDDRDPTAEELKQMKAMAGEAMAEGAFGLSTGLRYIPGIYAKTDEVVELANVVSEYGGFYATHMRSEGTELIEAVREAIHIGRQADIPVHISHKKAMGKSVWGASRQTLAMIDQAVEEGLDITMDQYPYAASSTHLQMIFSDWARQGGRDELKKRLESPDLRARIKEEIIANMDERAGGDPNNIAIGRFTPDTALEGKTIADITRMRGRKPSLSNAAETIMDLEYEGSPSAIYHCMHPEDIERIMTHPLVMHASDGSTHLFGEGKPHPRSYGTFPRVLGVYVRQQGLLSLPEAVAKMTSMPARRLGLDDRGILKEGMVADIVVFDPKTIIDTATYEDPHQYPEGIPYVLVSGEPIIDNGTRTEAFPGKVLYGPGKE